MSNTFFTSDIHIGHKLVSGHRGFRQMVPYVAPPGEEQYDVMVSEPDTAAHDAHVAAEWDRVVRPDDQVFVLGDVSINGSQAVLDWIEARPGRKHLITGNHDPVHPMRSKSEKLLPHWLQYFDTISPFSLRKLGGHSFLMSHFPYWPGDRGEPRFEQFRLPNLGLPLLHGHTHSDEKHEFENSLHVGWDAWGTLVPQQTVLEWLETL